MSDETRARQLALLLADEMFRESDCVVDDQRPGGKVYLDGDFDLAGILLRVLRREAEAAAVSTERTRT